MERLIIKLIFPALLFLLNLQLKIQASSPFCDLLAAMNNLHTVSGYGMWSCNTAGSTSTVPCTAPIWSGLTCSGNVVVEINFNSLGISGIFCF